MQEKRNLIAIDGNSLMHRAFYALPPMNNREGTPTNAVHGFLSMLLKLVEREPEYLLVAFDMHGPTFRHEEFAEYKAGRRETPDDLRAQFPILKSLLTEMGVAVCTCERYEADDILGTFARIANEEGVDTLLVTGDRDALQLVSAQTHVLLTKKGISETLEMDEAALMETYGLTPARMKDLKGLMGDGSDNIPGIPGVGEKTALKLLHEYGDLENVLAHAGEIKGKLGEKVQEFAEQARLSYRLGEIDTAAPVDIALSDTLFLPGRMADAVPALSRLQLNAIIKRLPQAEGMPPVQDMEEVPCENIDIVDLAALKAAAEALARTPLVALVVDEESMYLAGQGMECEYRVRLTGTLLEPGLDAAEVFAVLKPVFEAETPEKIVFDAKKWMHMLQSHGIVFSGLRFDAMIADYLLHANRPAATLEALTQERLQTRAGAFALLRLYPTMAREMERDGLLALYKDVEHPLIGVLYDMERTGFRVDAGVLHTLGVQFQTRIDELAADVYELAGEPFNILSTKQLGSVLFEKLNLPTQKKTKTGYSTDADVLEALSDMHPIVPLVQEYRFLTKLKSTFVDGLLQMISQGDGRVHTSFNQNVTATGRISSTEPNLQNIPVRTELGREIRKAFIASEGNMLIGGDYSQIELRLLAHISGDETMIDAFFSEADIHTRTASEVFGVPIENVTGEQRSAAKAVNFGIVYGISDFGLARNLRIGRKQAAEYIQLYLDRYPGVRAFMRESVEKGKRDGYAETLLGRRRSLPEIASSNYNTRSFGERVAMNMPIQGSAADIIKLAMVRVKQALNEKNLRAKLVLQVHDELILDAPPAECDEVEELLRECMQGAMELRVPLVVDVRRGKSWFDTK
ncbi:DNA polymerase I [Christensenellaceae bacterium OttesenSCG-928-L17]|nr:DNA polymerase I [Christensenellaceae bacterium OttesenSCG-928-L17]